MLCRGTTKPKLVFEKVYKIDKPLGVTTSSRNAKGYIFIDYIQIKRITGRYDEQGYVNTF